MAGKKSPPASIRLASGFQLFRLNQLSLGPFAGRAPVTAAEATRLIADELAAYGLAAFPRPGAQWPDRVDGHGDELTASEVRP